MIFLNLYSDALMSKAAFLIQSYPIISNRTEQALHIDWMKEVGFKEAYVESLSGEKSQESPRAPKASWFGARCAQNPCPESLCHRRFDPPRRLPCLSRSVEGRLS